MLDVQILSGVCVNMLSKSSTNKFVDIAHWCGKILFIQCCILQNIITPSIEWLRTIIGRHWHITIQVFLMWYINPWSMTIHFSHALVRGGTSVPIKKRRNVNMVRSLEMGGHVKQAPCVLRSSKSLSATYNKVIDRID